MPDLRQAVLQPHEVFSKQNDKESAQRRFYLQKNEEEESKKGVSTPLMRVSVKSCLYTLHHHKEAISNWCTCMWKFAWASHTNT